MNPATMTTPVTKRPNVVFAKFLRDVIDEIWYNDLKDADTLYTKVTAIDIMTLLDANSGGQHAINMISLRTNMTQYYT